jgi:CRP-like cAMP-binding protein
MISSKERQQPRIMRHSISFFCAPDKMIVVATYSCVSGNLLRITELTLTIGKSATFGMMMYLICFDQLAKIGHHALVIKKGDFFGYLALITASPALMSWVSKSVQKRI